MTGIPPAISPARRLARWVAPSAVAACAGALLGGLVEGAGGDGVVGVVATTGFLALLVMPALLVAGLMVRGLVAAWQPRVLVTRLVEPEGGAPRLAGWMAIVWLGSLALAWAVYEGTWALASASWLEFKPLGVGFAEPVIALASTLVLFALSRPGARGLSALARRLDARWRRAGHGTLLRPRAILVAAAVAGALATAVLWLGVVKPRLGPIDTSALDGPAVAIAVAVAVHLAWSRTPRRAVVGAALAVVAVASIATALVVRLTRPSLTLEIWGDRPLAGMAIDWVFDVDSIRANVSLAAFRPTDRPGASHPDIVLITIDTVRADHTPPYGGTAEMPVLRELAARGTVFTWAFAPSNVTRRSIPSMVIGLSPNRIRGRVVGWALRVDPRHVLLAERLSAGGYETAGFMCCYGFWSPEVHTGLQRGLEHLEIEPNGRKLAAAARAWLDERERRPGNRPMFLWMHILEPHNWTVGVGEPRNDAERHKFYDKALADSDAMVGELVGAFANRSPEHAPIVIVTADHGEALGEHGHQYHSTDLYNSQMRVPLVMTGPGIRQQTIPETVSLTDLVPTIVELAGYQPPSGANIDGRSLADLTSGKRGSAPDTGAAFAAMIKDRSNPGGVTALAAGRWKVIDNGSALELYDLYSDADERTNLANLRPEIVERLRVLLEAKTAAAKISPFD
ncbi:MAG: Choline-sulfatase [Deltaproteobacteria bacterium]|nr:Choline-sulfatase [Deltaproteobacteria bacterium]